MVGLKINLNMAWTLPFIMIGLGVDDMVCIVEMSYYFFLFFFRNAYDYVHLYLFSTLILMVSFFPNKFSILS